MHLSKIPGSVDRLYHRLLDVRDDLRRAFNEFLRIPTYVVSGFLLLAYVFHLLDRGDIDAIEPMRTALRRQFFIDADTTSDLLAAIAAGIISVTSITISLLLIAVQQAAGSLTTAVFDQFLRRRRNQAYFGFFVGLALYCLVTLATVHESSNAVLGASVAFALTVAALYILIILFYSTIHQMRSAVIVAAIRDHVLAARTRQLPLLYRTRRTSARGAEPTSVVRSVRTGFVCGIDIDALAQTLSSADPSHEITLLVSIGDFVAWQDPVAELRGGTGASRDELCERIPAALRIERLRDIHVDPAYGIGQVARIGWTTISTAKSSPGPAAHAIRALRDLMARWADEPGIDPDVAVLPIVYTDTVWMELLDTFESFAVSTVESTQHQSFAAIFDAFAATVERLPDARRRPALATLERLVPLVGEHIATRELAESLGATATMLGTVGRQELAARIRAASDRLGRPACAAQS